MNCNETEKKISAFLKDSLSVSETKAFINHIENCKKCYDECEVRYMVKYTSVALDQDESISYDLTRLLPRKIKARKKWVRHEMQIRIVFLVIAVLIAAGLVIFAVLNKNPDLMAKITGFLKLR